MTDDEREAFRDRITKRIVQVGVDSSWGAFLYMTMTVGLLRTLAFKLLLMFRSRKARLNLARKFVRRDLMVEVISERPEAMLMVHLTLICQFTFLAGSRIEARCEAYDILDTVVRKARWNRACKGLETDLFDELLAIGSESVKST